ncbi:DUF397 domain-containing protein [Streptomyces antibioticus]
MRDSKDRSRRPLTVSGAAWHAFLGGHRTNTARRPRPPHQGRPT